VKFPSTKSRIFSILRDAQREMGIKEKSGFHEAKPDKEVSNE